MISQSDIIRTLVNKNCTDESIMSTALSPNCTPTKLLEKFTEAERFDLALDISMKLGLETAPLWKNWAMRCLKHRNFLDARDKFKFCFQRLKPQSKRSSIGLASSELLGEILMVLTQMDETKVSLKEEIESIKNQDFNNLSLIDEKVMKNPISETILNKPNIHNECILYLKEYGTVRDYIKFYVEHSLWDSLIDILMDNRSRLGKDKSFITDVFLQTASTGRLDNLITGFLKVDKNLESSRSYFQSIYDHCTGQRRYNLLNYIQYKIGDYVAAAESQINHYFLREPVRNYKELNQRLASLYKALENYQEYLRKLGDKKHSISMKNDLKRRDAIKHELYSEMSFFNVERRISTIELQIEITKNFSLNEISGCMGEIEPLDDCINEVIKNQNKLPVTLFDHSERRKIFMVALVLVYFDPECRSYFSSKGFELTRHLTRINQLNKLDVYKTAMRVIIEDESCNISESTRLLLERLKQDYDEEIKLVTKHTPLPRLSMKPICAGSGDMTSSSLSKFNSAQACCDEVIRDSIKSCREADYKMELAMLLSPKAKIELYIEFGKLSNAQHLAFAMNWPDYVAKIIEEAEKLNQNHVKIVCQHWLAKYESNSILP